MSIQPIDFPSSGGITRIPVNIPPVSLQSSGERKNAVKNAVIDITKDIDFILTGDLKIEIEWYVNEDERYETDKSADADNIIKPIVDALSGPSGVIVNDCQVQSVSSYWLDRFNIPEHIEIELTYGSDPLYFTKQSIVFVKIKNGLCLPINDKLNPEILIEIIELFVKELNYRDKLILKGYNPLDARYILPIQRIFHVSRCKEFSIYDVCEYREMLKKRAK